MTTKQVAMRLPEEALDQIDRLVADGRYDDRSHFFRTAIDGLLDAEERRETGEAIVEGYLRRPWTDLSEDSWDYESWKASRRAAG
jgi:Arc/MetJ-type ribon-helix-helix transcriptional regulator